jgi:hypothetical protein
VSCLAAAERTGEWLIAAADQRPDGWCWPAQPGATDEFAPGIGWGTAGPVMFFAEAFATTGNQRWLDAARQGARWMAANLDAVAAEWAGCGLFTGIGGWAVALDLLAERTGGDHEFTSLAERVIGKVIASASRTANGANWGEITEILWGTAGIGCLLLTLGPRYAGPPALALAASAGDWLLGEVEEAKDGIRWSLSAGAYATGHYAQERRFPNFAHGTAGIAFFLARLAQETGERRFRDASLNGANWVLSTARTGDGTCAAFHHEPDGTELFTLGWCHGPPGLGWLFRQLEVTTGDQAWRAWLRRAARADTASGIPERREPGFWDNVARCCGSAGVAEFFLDLHTLEGDEADLAFARLLVDDLLGRAITDESGTRWSNYEFRRADQPDLPPETGYLQGAPGIGSTLLRLHRHLAGDPWTVNWPHAPAWNQPPSVRLRCTCRSARISSARSPVPRPARVCSASARISGPMTCSSSRPRSVSTSRTSRPSLGCGSRRSSPAASIRVAARVTVGVARPSCRAIWPGVRPSCRHRRRSTNCWPSYTPCRANTPVDACASACLASRKASANSSSWSPSPSSAARSDPWLCNEAAGWLDVSGMARQAYAGGFTAPLASQVVSRLMLISLPG